jgi:hypothetical protein
VVLLALLAVGLGWFVATDTTLRWNTEPGDQISAHPPGEPAAMAAQERRTPRSSVASAVDQHLALTPAAIVSLSAMLALATAVLLPLLDPGPRRRERHLAGSLRSPPASMAVPVA